MVSIDHFFFEHPFFSHVITVAFMLRSSLYRERQGKFLLHKVRGKRKGSTCHRSRRSRRDLHSSKACACAKGSPVTCFTLSLCEIPAAPYSLTCHCHSDPAETLGCSAAHSKQSAFEGCESKLHGLTEVGHATLARLLWMQWTPRSSTSS